MLPLKKILCPTDFSEPSYEALKVGNELALHFSAELYLMYVVVPIPMMRTSQGIKTYQREVQEIAEENIQKVVEQRISKKVKVHKIVLSGDAANEIARVAKEESVDLIVIATHGLSGWHHLFFGSVTEKVLKIAPCPLLAIKAPAEQDAK